MIQNVEHQKLVDALLLHIGGLPQVRLWPRIVGLATPWGMEHPLQFGNNGETDLDGILAPFGRRLAIEVKTGKSYLSKDQIRWRKMIERFGGLYIEARNVHEPFEIVNRYLQSVGFPCQSLDK
jgi:hypothetical protein